MITARLKGGLGNQMFQYAIGYCLSKKKNTSLYFDTRLMEEHKINPPPRNVPRDYDLDVFDIEKKLVKKKPCKEKLWKKQQINLDCKKTKNLHQKNVQKKQKIEKSKF